MSAFASIALASLRTNWLMLGRCFPPDTAGVVLAVSYGRRVDGPHNPVVTKIQDKMSKQAPSLLTIVAS
jgi:hypothetical protein